MSRIGKHPVPVPAGVDVSVVGQTVTAKGKLGTLTNNLGMLYGFKVSIPAPGKAALFGLPHLVRGKGAQCDLRKVNHSPALLRLRLHQVNLRGRLRLRCGFALLFPRVEPLKRVADPERPGFKVHILPAKGESFTLPESERHSNGEQSFQAVPLDGF